MHRVTPVKSESIRALHNARRSAMKARTAAMVQIFHQLVTAPADIRQKYRDLNGDKRIAALARMQIRTAARGRTRRPADTEVPRDPMPATM